MTTTKIVPAENLAESCIWAAKANRWLLQVIIPERSQAEYASFDTASDALQIIYDAENAGKISHKCADRAVWYVKEATGHHHSGLT